MSIYRNEEGRWILSTNNPDVVEVVRCKDCKDWTTWNDPTGTQSNYCPILDYWTKGEFYCAHGDRREND